MYIRGDLIPGVGIVDVNHCGMPLADGRPRRRILRNGSSGKLFL